MSPPWKFISIRPEESLAEVRKMQGVSLRELLDQLNEYNNNQHDSPSKEKKSALTYYNLSEEDRVAQEQLKRLRGALNKLTADNFYVQLLEIREFIPVGDYHLMSIFVRQLIDKVINEELYSPLYAHLCNALKDIFLGKIKDENIYNFGSFVLDECYGRFYYARSNINWFSFNHPTPEEKEELIAKEKYKEKLLLGVVRFLGDLYKAGMVETEDIYQYVKKLEQDDSEKSLEALCKLLTIVGKELEVAIFQTDYETDWCKTWERILNLSKNENIGLRQKLLLTNLLDLMNSSWQSKFVSVFPKSYAEILLENRDLDEEKEINQSSESDKNMMDDITAINEVISIEPVVLEMEKQILHLLKTKNEASIEITKWELENFKGRKTWLTYALTKAVLQVSIEGNNVNKTTFTNNIALLKRYIISRQTEVSCIYASQHVVIIEMKNPKGLLEQICELLHSEGIVSYIAFLDWRENWSKNPVLQIEGKAEAQITLAKFFIKLFSESIKQTTNYKSIVKELSSFDLEHFVSISKLPPEIEKRIKMEEEREKDILKQSNTDDHDKSTNNNNINNNNNNNNQDDFFPIKTL